MSAPTAAPAKKKSKLKMPHLLFLMLGLILLISLLTYIVPAGQFATDPETGALIGDEFHLLGHQTPVNIWQALNYILPGFMNSSYVISLLLISGGCVGVIMGTGAFDEMVNWALYKLQDKGVSVLVPIVFMVIAIHGGFGGGDSMIALVPLGVMMAKKLRLDPIMAVALTFFASFTGFAVGPRRISTAQLMMDVPMYSGFVERTVILLVIITIGMLYTLHYARKIAKDPTKSAMGNTDWMETYHAETGDEMEVVAFNPRAALVTVLFFAQYFVIVYMMTVLGMANTIMPAVQIPVAILCGLIYGQNLDKIGAAFAKGTSGMAFVAAVIGLAGTMSLVMENGNILHTIVYYACLPLRELSLGLASVGMSAIVAFLNLFVPSASAKMAILIPIIKPMAESLGMSGNLAVSAFQFGDGFTNLVTPALGATAGSLAIAGVPLSKWLKWALPITLLMLVVSWIILYFLGSVGWTGV